jgi:hypothetical protein
LRDADAKGDEKFIDGCYHVTVTCSVAGLEHVVDV